MIKFQWDDNKNRINQKKHGISFEEAQSVFFDENALMIHDPDHSEEEERFLLLGMSANLRMLIVCHCYRDEDSVIRIISARNATSTEKRQYNKRLRR